MIYTVTFNPSIDYIMFTDGFELKGLNRAKETYKFAGGKGINVSRVLKTLDVDSTALGFAGGFPGKFISKTLEESKIHTDFIEVDEDTRINVKLKSGQETEINAPGPKVTQEQFQALITQIKNTTSEDTVIVAGSVPNSIPSDAYAQIAEITKNIGAKLVVDAEKDLVDTVLPYRPLFIKPNKDELEVMFNTTVSSDHDVVKYGKEILKKGAQSVIISLGGDGAIYVDEHQSIKAVNPQGKVINTVGSGDSTVAGMVAGLESGLSIQDAFKQAVASGTATAFEEDLATRDAIEKIKSQVTVSVLDGGVNLMRITELLTKDTIAMDLSASDKNGVIDELVNQLDKAGKLSDVASFKEAIHNRESQSTTGIGEGIAIPHAKVAAVKSPAIAFGKSKEGVDYQSLDMQPAHLFFMIAAPEGGAQTHLDALAKLSGILMDENVREKLINAESPEKVLQIIDEADDEATKEEEAEAQENEANASGAVASTSASEHANDSNEPYVLAVTACPTGIAHTYMARDALKKQAEKMDVKIKVETNGSSGVKNHLIEQDIERATGIIVAADVHVETDRFNGKNVVEVPVADGIKRPEELINTALDTSRKPFVARGDSAKENDDKNEEKLSPGKAFYKHLMNGVSNMLPLVIAGGILMAIVFLFGPNSFNPKSSEHNAFAEQLWNIGKNSAFALIIPVLAGFISRSISDKPGFAAGLVGGMLAISGGSGFIGGIIAGFLAGYLTQGIKYITRKLPQAVEGLKPTLIYPVLSVTITGLLMVYVFNPPASWLNHLLLNGLNSLSGSNIMLLGLVVGAMMAIDMGGPFNKAAYVFATAALTEGNAAPITAAMIGGMIPPLAIATTMLVFRKKFTKEQRGSIVPNYVMGLSFITEGAIPFAAADPLRVIPSMMVGSGVAGAIALGLGSRINAPHGGIIVILATDFSHVLQTILALVVGTLVSALLYGFLKPKVTKNEIQASKAMDE